MGITPQASYPWPTEPIIFAAWHENRNPTSYPDSFYRKVGDGCYEDIVTGIKRFKGGGHFLVWQAYAEAEQLWSRTEELRQLQQALQDKNRKLKGYREALKLANHTGRTNAYALGVQHGVTQERAKHRPHRYMHAQIYKVQDSDQWSVEIHYRASRYAWMALPSYDAAVAWALAKMRDIHDNNYPR